MARRPLLVPLILVSLLLSGSVPAEEERFLTERETALLDDALALMNMTRKDLEFDKLILEDDWRLPVVDRTLSRPLEATDVAWAWAKRAKGKPSAILGAAADELHSPDRPPFMRKPLDQAQRERLRRWAYAALVDDDAHDGQVPKPEVDEDPESMLGLAHGYGSSERARRLLEDLEASFARGGEIRLRDVNPDEIRFGTPGDDVHDLREDPPKLLIDPGGNDRYLAPARSTSFDQIAIVVDLGGNDVYGDGESLSAGAALWGTAILWDRGDGDDLYRCGHLSQGCGVFGVGVLIDEGGNDVYRCRDTGQGAGAWGIGLLLDRGEGNDTFHADLFGQGFAYVGGFGLLHNEKGQDVYEAGGVHLHYPLFNDRYQSLSQGFSIGMRPYASGGVGLLVDDAGNDRYACDIYGQGASYWFSYGALIDRDGNDTYTLGQYGQGGGIHLSVGVLLDLKGQDLYYNMHGVGTGGAHDWAVGILVDRAGDDYYAGSGGTMGGALTNSFAMLLDAAGNDGYSAVKVRHAEGGGRSARGMGSIGVLLDLAGKDLHGTRDLDGAAWTKETYGAGIDLPDPPPEKGAAPAGRPKLTPEEAEARVREKVWDVEKSAYDIEKLWDVAKQWAVGEMADVVPVATKRLIELGDPAMEMALSHVGTRNGLELRAVQAVLKAFRDEAIPRLVTKLEDDDDRTRSRAASLLADLDAKESAEAVLPLLGHDKTKLAALDALGRLGAASRWKDVSTLLTDEKERVRVAAVRCLQKLEAKDAIPDLVARLAGDEIFTVRFAAEDVLVAFGEDSINALFARCTTEPDLTRHRHAIRALGRITPHRADLLALLASHARKDDWRLRYDAVGALGAVRTTGGQLGILATDQLEERAKVETNHYVKTRIAQLLKNGPATGGVR